MTSKGFLVQNVDSARLGRYGGVDDQKAHGVTYTPKVLADFVARQVVAASALVARGRALRLFDPAVGDGQLLISLVEQLDAVGATVSNVSGFETDGAALEVAQGRLATRFPDLALNFHRGSFLDFVLADTDTTRDLLSPPSASNYDLVIANPPYVRTQVMGAAHAQSLAATFGLSGRVDLYHAFIFAMARVLVPDSVVGLIVSNRFMTTRSGEAVRKVLLQQFDLLHVWDLGDTKLFDAAVLPGVLLARGPRAGRRPVRFTSIYETSRPAGLKSRNPVEALDRAGVVSVADGRRFDVAHGRLDTGGSQGGVWCLRTDAIERWLATVESHAWCRFGQIGSVRVGVKTCADKVFIRDDWDTMGLSKPELLRPIITHHVANRYRAVPPSRQVLYPHHVVQGRRRAVDLSLYPLSQGYLEQHRARLQGRRYLVEAGRLWYELWVPQDPDAWCAPKAVFRDIAEKPVCWLDDTGAVVNGDCYWLACRRPSVSDQVRNEDLLWLVTAVANSSFVERFYDCRFNNKLYAGRRRFMAQYVEQFPLPDPCRGAGQAIIQMARQIGELAPDVSTAAAQQELDAAVWEAFGLRGADAPALDKAVGEAKL